MKNIWKKICCFAAVIAAALVLGMGSSAYADYPTYDTPQGAGEYLRETLIQSEDASAKFFYITDVPEDNKRQIVEEIFFNVPNKTGSGSDGAYLTANQVVDRAATLLSTTSNGRYKYFVTFKTRKRTTADMEKQVNAKAKQILSDLHMDSMSDFEKVNAIFSYLVENTTYTKNGVCPYTAYGVLVDRQAVCEGYSAAFYKLATEAGLNCYIVEGYPDEGGAGHVWNIVEVDGKCYFIDSTWGAAYGYSHFLRGTSDFTGHEEYKNCGYVKDHVNMAKTAFMMSDEFFESSSPEYFYGCDDAVFWLNPENGHKQWNLLTVIEGSEPVLKEKDGRLGLKFSTTGSARIIVQEKYGKKWKFCTVEAEVDYHNWYDYYTKGSFTEEGEHYRECANCMDLETIEIYYRLKSLTMAESKAYTGSLIKPAVTIKNTEGREVKAGTTYTVTYTNNKSVGKAKAVIKGKGHYSFTKVKYFKILPKKASVKTLTAGKKKLTVKMGGKVSSTGGSTYEIRYRVKGSSKWKTVTTTSSSKTLKSLKKGKRYQVQVRAYKAVSGSKYYGAWSDVKTSGKIK